MPTIEPIRRYVVLQQELKDLQTLYFIEQKIQIISHGNEGLYDKDEYNETKGRKGKFQV